MNVLHRHHFGKVNALTIAGGMVLSPRMALRTFIQLLGAVTSIVSAVTYNSRSVTEVKVRSHMFGALPVFAL